MTANGALLVYTVRESQVHPSVALGRHSLTQLQFTRIELASAANRFGG